MAESLELRIEQMKCLSNIRYELLQTVYDGRPVYERYLDGSVAIHAHMFSGKDSLCVSVINAETQRVPDNTKLSMFVWVREVSEELRPVASFVRLQALEHCSMFSGQPFKVPFVSLEVIFGIYNNKLSVIYDALGIKTGQLINQVIKGCPEVVHDIPDNSADFEWGREINRARRATVWHFDPPSINVNDSLLILQGNIISYDLKECGNFRPKGIQVFPCPVDPLISAIETMHMLYYPQITYTVKG